MIAGLATTLVEVPGFDVGLSGASCRVSNCILSGVSFSHFILSTGSNSATSFVSALDSTKSPDCSKSGAGTDGGIGCCTW